MPELGLLKADPKHVNMNSISFFDFKSLLDYGHWGLRKGIYDHWTVERHLLYIENLIANNPNSHVQFSIDSPSLELARKIDVIIFPSTKGADIITTKHILFEYLG